ncbi:MAG: hypothetical protein JOZ14_11720 [Acidobacteria bacterium]|nr:hypothetical protein [Acidobacteriota bacterium]
MTTKARSTFPAEELLNDVAKIAGPRVVGRTSSFQFKGKTEDWRTVGEKLNVSTMLEGSVRKEGRPDADHGRA